MKTCRFDAQQGRYVKVSQSIGAARREVEGARVFRSIVHTPDVERIGKRTISSTPMKGARGDTIATDVLTGVALDMLRRSYYMHTDFAHVDNMYFIGAKIRQLMRRFPKSSEVRSFLHACEAEVACAKIIPIHGDLQKENMFISPEGELGLIDFEHFAYAPMEFELVNSMFHNDDNCLDAEHLFRELMNDGLISESLVRKALVIYALARGGKQR